MAMTARPAMTPPAMAPVLVCEGSVVPASPGRLVAVEVLEPVEEAAVPVGPPVVEEGTSEPVEEGPSLALVEDALPDVVLDPSLELEVGLDLLAELVELPFVELPALVELEAGGLVELGALEELPEAAGTNGISLNPHPLLPDVQRRRRTFSLDFDGHPHLRAL